MRLKAKFITAVMASGLMLIASCSSPKDITYMQGFDAGAAQAVRQQSRITVQPDDKLSIVVTSKNPELAEVFNLAVAQHRVGYISNPSVSNNSVTAPFTVSPDGTIDYPILGTLQVAGLSRQQVSELIKEKLVAGNLLSDPTVTVDFLNATVSVLGDVARPGEYTIDRDNMNLLQAISKAGDLQITGQRENVLVVREVDGKDVAYRVNLTDPESLFQSPAFYMQQNDVVYVEPNETKKRQATAWGNTVLTPAFWISVASLLTTITAIIVK